MSIELLLGLVSPPPNPVATGSSEAWEKVEQALKFTFPSDYKNCVNHYGSGGFCEVLLLTSPFWQNEDYAEWVKTELSDYTTTSTSFPDAFPFSVYPEEGGLYPWAVTTSGEKLFWETSGIPDEWPTIVYSARGSEFERWHLSVTEFIYGWISGALDTHQLPKAGHHKFFSPTEP